MLILHKIVCSDTNYYRILKVTWELPLKSFVCVCVLQILDSCSGLLMAQTAKKSTFWLITQLQDLSYEAELGLEALLDYSVLTDICQRLTRAV